MADLIEFLRNRLDEDREAAARTGGDRTPPGGAGRLLREAEAKQRLLTVHVPDALALHGRTCAECRVPEPGFEYGVPSPFPCRTLTALATVYADHPDYRPEWAPAT